MPIVTVHRFSCHASLVTAWEYATNEINYAVNLKETHHLKDPPPALPKREGEKNRYKDVTKDRASCRRPTPALPKREGGNRYKDVTKDHTQ